MENNIKHKYDIVVIGAGHAGCEAALATARLGFETLLFTVSVDAIAMMPCNPNIGGTSKGHLVREVDALGGEMGRNIDATFIQSRMLNRSKGPAVHSLRAQADKQAYSRRMRTVLENTPGLTIRQSEVSELIVRDGRCCGVRATSGAVYESRAVILCTGVYLNARCLCGELVTETGPNGLMAATHLTQSLLDNGIEILRFKTGTPARIDGRTIDYSRMEVQPGDAYVTPFSFETDPESVQIEQIPCYLTHTTEETHEIIRNNLDRSPLFAGMIEGTGPRYCPSIEDKVVKFAEKTSHQVFIEPEGRYTNEVYIDGMSSSLPEDVQEAMYRSVPGLENARIVRNAYAIEYDLIDPNQLRPTLELKKIPGLYAAGQVNGSSGYEEAAAQGLIAGINAAIALRGEEPLILDRSEAYIGVLIDDLVTKETREPYRMMTSRAEYRLLLRQDNADLRLRAHGHRVGLVSDALWEKTQEKQRQIEAEVQRVEKTHVGMSAELAQILAEAGSQAPKGGCTLADLIRRPELDYQRLAPIDTDRPDLARDVAEQVNIQVKYEGYISRQNRQIEQFRKKERRKIPADIDYDEVQSLRIEARQKLAKIRPENIGQASRIQGVSPADVSVLLVYLEAHK